MKKLSWMFRVPLLCAMAVGALVASGAASAADIVRQPRELAAPFSQMRVVGEYDVVLVQGPSPSVVVEATKSAADRIKVEVKDGTLVIGDTSSGWTIQLGGGSIVSPRIYVTAPNLSRISIEGAGDVSSTAWTTPDAIEWVLTGSGDLRVDNLNARHASFNITGSGDVQVGGAVAEQEVKIRGSGDYKAGALKSNSASVTVTGSGDAVVWATQALSMSIRGSGDIHFYGSPTVSQSVAGSGDVIAMGEKR